MRVLHAISLVAVLLLASSSITAASGPTLPTPPCIPDVTC